jgi:hypothetical protein
MSTDNLRDLTLVKMQQVLNQNNTELKTINSNFKNLNKILSVFLILAVNENSLKSKTLKEIKTIIPNYTELLKTISENIK